MTAPTFQPYLDRGCKLAPKCLACPLPVCKEDMASSLGPGWHTVYQAPMRAQRDAAIRTKRTTEGTTAKDLAVEFQLTERTIYKIFARGVREVANAVG